METMCLYSLWWIMAFIPSMLAIIFMILTMNSSGGQSSCFCCGSVYLGEATVKRMLIRPAQVPGFQHHIAQFHLCGLSVKEDGEAEEEKNKAPEH